MSLIVSCMALTVFVGVFVLRPLFRESANSPDMEFMAETEQDRLMDRKIAIYSNLKDLAFEYEMGRLSDEDFRHLEADYKTDAAVILQKLEQMVALEHSGESIEKDSTFGNNVDSIDEPEPQGNETQCPSCGANIIPGKKFCADCGQKL